MLDNLETFSQSIKASLMVLLLGVGIASVTDLQLNLLGSIIAVLTIAATCVGQIVSFCLLSSHELKKKKAAKCHCFACTVINFHPACPYARLVILNLHNLDLNKADQPNSEEAQGVLHAAAVPVFTVPVCRATRHRPVRRQAPDQARRLRLQLHRPSRGKYSTSRDNYPID
jgi:hypothetical protein